LYNKGSCVLWTLRAELGEAGFWEGVRLYLTRHAHQTVHTRHFQRALEEASGRNLDRFFEQWVHSPGHPQLDVSLAQGDGLLTVGIRQNQSGDDVPEAFALKLRLEVVYTDGRTRQIDLPVAERDRTWAVPMDGDIATVRVDPGFRVLAEIKLKAPEPWLRVLLDDDCPVLTVRAATALLATDSVRAVSAVCAAMGAHTQHNVRSALVGAIGKRGGPAAMQALCEALPDEDDPRVRASLLAALGRFSKTEAADAMIADSERGLPTVQLHGAFLEGLGRTRDPRAHETLTADLDEETWAWWVTRKALTGLGAARDVRAFDVLVEYTAVGKHDRVRGAAAAALSALADKVPDLRQRAVERLVEMLDEPGFSAQLVTIGSLAVLKDPSSLGALGQVHRTAPDGRTRRSAYEAMVRIRQGRDPGQGLSNLRARLDKLEEQNRTLRDRIARFEHVES
jgi:aminopeptidase N